METNKSGVQDSTPVINLKNKPENLYDLFNITDERHDEIEVGIKRAYRNLMKANPTHFGSDELITAFVKVAKTPEELGFIMIQAGMKIVDLRNSQDSIVDALGPHLANLLGGLGKRGKVSVKKGNIDDFLDDILNHRGH